MPTIKDVAKEAGVSIATVSRVINNRGYLSDNVKKAVHDAMETLDYHPNDLARSLHNQRSNILGIIVPAVSHPFFSRVVQEIELETYHRGFKLLVCNSEQDIDKEREYINMLRRSQVDGIIMGSHLQNVEEYSQLSLPVVTLDRQISGHIPYISCDNFAGGEMATRHLLEKGCTNLIHLCGELGIEMLANQRTDAFTKVCQEAQVPYQLVELPDNAISNPVGQLETITEAIAGTPDCDGVFATSDLLVPLVVRAAKACGKSVPDDLKIVGFDGIDVFRLFQPAPTSIYQPIDTISHYAVEYLVRQIEGEQVPSQTTIPVELMEGETT